MNPADYPPPLRRRQASFVTLSSGDGRLRGCCGATLPIDSLVEDLVTHAWRTAFDDPRFPPVESAELEGLRLEIALLTALQPIDASTRSKLLAGLVPGETGVLIGAGEHRSTFLPKVWQSLRDPEEFLDQLLAKGRFPPGAWPTALQAYVYRVKPIVGLVA